MRIDCETDPVPIVLLDAPLRESEEERSGATLDHDASGKLVALEVLDASTRSDAAQ